jgi:DNA mismatch repair protein MutS2
MISSEVHFGSNKRIISATFLSEAEASHSLNIIDTILPNIDLISNTKARLFTNLRLSEQQITDLEMLSKFRPPSSIELAFCSLAIKAFNELTQMLNCSALLVDEPDSDALKSLLRLSGEVLNFIEPDGNILYDKHPELKEIQNDIDLLNRQLRQSIQGIARSEIFSNALSNDQYDIVSDRFVLSVMADRYRSELGFIIDRSNRGMTLFVEPHEIRGLSNKRLQLLAKRDEVINSLLIKLGAQLSKNYADFSNMLSYLFKLDLSVSKAVFSSKPGYSRPDFGADTAISLKDFFHPLINNPVKNDLNLDQQHKGILISGPNTGGKTVALKSIAICILLSRLGLYVPATYASLPSHTNLYFFSHDNQDLAQGLSSFSSEAIEYINLIVNNELDHSLIFVDEMFNSTSSEEASALAIALCEHVSSRKNTKIFISSHHHRLKFHIHGLDTFISSHVGFNIDTQRPTYKLISGTPGASMAITIFSQLGGSNQLIQELSKRAEVLLDTSHMEYEKLLEEVQIKSTELDSLLSENHVIKSALENQKKSSDGLLFLEREKLLNDYKVELFKLLQDAIRTVESIKESANKNPTQALKKVRQVENRFRLSNDDRFDPDSSGSSDAPSPKLGQRYYCTLTKADSIIHAVNASKGLAQVSKGSIRIWVPYSSLLQPKNTPQKTTVHVQREQTGSIDFDARGMRLDAFQSQLTKHLEDLYCGDIPYLNVIHGHGDGILKSWLRSYLKSEDLFWSTPDGNDGITTIKLT